MIAETAKKKFLVEQYICVYESLLNFELPVMYFFCVLVNVLVNWTILLCKFCIIDSVVYID